MAERPIILFGTPTVSRKSKRPGGSSKIQRPSHSRQTERLEPKMESLQNALITLQQSPTGIEAERTFVFEVAGSSDDFYTAVKSWGDDAEWIFDVPEEIFASDDFYEYKEDKKTKERTRRNDKAVIGGKIYCVLTNTRALDEMLQLWGRYKQNPNTQFPTGKAGLKHVFECLSDIHIWGYKERIEETGILDVWKEELQDLDSRSVKCEIELFFRKLHGVRRQKEDDLVATIIALGGTVLGRSEIEDIAYHSILADLPRDAVEMLINKDENVALLTAEQIMFFRPVGQAIYISDGDDIPTELSVPDANGVVDEPIIALFDGLPQENHPFLQNHLTIDDPDDYASKYTVTSRKHGTSMASLVALGDLSGDIRQASHKIYIRPIMTPVQGLNDTHEEIPNDILLVDKIHEAVRRLYAPEAGAVAPTVKIINLSIGIGYRQFDRSISPLARLLDWLSYTYRVLFVVSAGNHYPFKGNWEVGVPFSDFATCDLNTRDETVINWMNDNARNHRLLSPSESINSLTVGAVFDDESSFNENVRQIVPCSNGMLSPISAIGKGINNSVKPDIVFPGGKNVVTENLVMPNALRWLETQRKPGTQSAAPFIPGSNIKTAYSFGTSNSAALISHEASRCYDALVDVFAETDQEPPSEYIALLLKAMLIHGAEWDSLGIKFADVLGLSGRQQISDNLHRFFGYGKPNIDRAIECAKKRITLIGYGTLSDGDAHLYDLPLPFDFNREKIKRRLTATLVNFSPIIPARQVYRSTQLWFTFENSKKHLIDDRIDTDWQAAVRGTVQHEIFENEKIVAWGEDDALQLKVNCRATTDNHPAGSVPYAFIASFEIKSDIDVDVYAKIAEKVRPRVTIQPRAEDRGDYDQ